MRPWGRAIHPLVEELRGRPQVIKQIGRRRIECPEQKASVARDPGNPGQSVVVGVEAGTEGFGKRDSQEPAVVGIHPAVIAAGEPLSRSAGFATHSGSPMAASVEQGMDLAVAVAGEDDGTQPETAGAEVVRLGDLGLVAQIDPGRAEDLAHLHLEDGGIGVETAMNSILLDEFVPESGVGPRLSY